ncbi:hypothetical protein F2Q69_00063330 [Brassica cretica]|uniref:Uncharacterized protein n=1 Tax=Brassica cretica TaxID=69181 RepID=A0A8S9RMT4_BRACR|nr:hypothetical protein F2Q69_00063330 [Brassica cretica]
MFILRRPQLTRHLRNNRFASVESTAAVRQDATLWTPAPLSLIESAAESLFHISDPAATGVRGSVRTKTNGRGGNINACSGWSLK